MDIKEPELSNAIQGASQRIYNKMLKTTENIAEVDVIANNNRTDELSVNDDAKKVRANKLSNGDTNTLDEYLPGPKIEVQISDLSDGNAISDQKHNELQSHPVYSSRMNDGNRLSQKNAICYHDLSEGEAVASKLNDYRLVKGMSKSIGNNLNNSHNLSISEEKSACNYPFGNHLSEKDPATKVSHLNNGTSCLFIL